MVSVYIHTSLKRLLGQLHPLYIFIYVFKKSFYAIQNSTNGLLYPLIQIYLKTLDLRVRFVIFW